MILMYQSVPIISNCRMYQSEVPVLDEWNYCMYLCLLDLGIVKSSPIWILILLINNIYTVANQLVSKQP